MNIHEVRIKVRFNEVDAYRVAWHGHYVSWMEMGRNALSCMFGLDPGQLEELGYMGPVISLELNYHSPARFNDEIVVRTTLRQTETATLVFESMILNSDGKKLAAGVTTHALTDMNGVLQFRMPPGLLERVENMRAWLEGP